MSRLGQPSPNNLPWLQALSEVAREVEDLFGLTEEQRRETLGLWEEDDRLNDWRGGSSERRPLPVVTRLMELETQLSSLVPTTRADQSNWPKAARKLWGDHCGGQPEKLFDAAHLLVGHTVYDLYVQLSEQFGEMGAGTIQRFVSAIPKSDERRSSFEEGFNRTGLIVPEEFPELWGPVLMTFGARSPIKTTRLRQEAAMQLLMPEHGFSEMTPLRRLILLLTLYSEVTRLLARSKFKGNPYPLETSIERSVSYIERASSNNARTRLSEVARLINQAIAPGSDPLNLKSFETREQEMKTFRVLFPEILQAMKVVQHYRSSPQS